MLKIGEFNFQILRRPERKCCNFESVTESAREELGGKVLCRQIEQSVDEPILLANIMAADLSLAKCYLRCSADV
jgi:hypothetical protein